MFKKQISVRTKRLFVCLCFLFIFLIYTDKLLSVEPTTLKLQTMQDDKNNSVEPGENLGVTITLERVTSKSTNEATVTFADVSNLTTPKLTLNQPNNIPTGVTCSLKPSLSGSNQKVITYTIYGADQGYWSGLPKIMNQAKVLYPTWFVRVYTDNPNNEVLRNLSQMYSFLQICDINILPPPHVSLKEYPSKMWRIHPLGDPQIDVVVFRDADSELLVREHDAVEEWLNRTSKSLHLMRDHPHHGIEIMAGMWGARLTSVNRKKWTEMRDSLLEKSYRANETYDLDQTLLRTIVWPVFKEDFIAHDSYTCSRFPGSVPFPTQRTNGAFVGSQIFRLNYNLGLAECPEECRPAQHKDWTYC